MGGYPGGRGGTGWVEGCGYGWVQVGGVELGGWRDVDMGRYRWAGWAWVGRGGQCASSVLFTFCRDAQEMICWLGSALLVLGASVCRHAVTRDTRTGIFWWCVTSFGCWLSALPVSCPEPTDVFLLGVEVQCWSLSGPALCHPRDGLTSNLPLECI